MRPRGKRPEALQKVGTMAEYVSIIRRLYELGIVAGLRSEDRICHNGSYLGAGLFGVEKPTNKVVPAPDGKGPGQLLTALRVIINQIPFNELQEECRRDIDTWQNIGVLLNSLFWGVRQISGATGDIQTRRRLSLF